MVLAGLRYVMDHPFVGARQTGHGTILFRHTTLRQRALFE
jgi:hypothetical protein